MLNRSFTTENLTWNLYTPRSTITMIFMDLEKNYAHSSDKTSRNGYQNISVVRTNSMKFIPNYFEKGQLTKMFFLFPDPHFKEKNHRRRVFRPHLLDEYAYTLAVGGVIYTITDVEELGEWMKSCLDEHPMFDAVSKKELKPDLVGNLLTSPTEEGQKVAGNVGQTFQAIYRRVPPTSS